MHDSAPRERTHGLLWLIALAVIAGLIAWWFAHWFRIGARHGRDLGALKPPASQAAPVDHAALIKDAGDAVLAKGEALYAGNCASCHGATGEPPAGNPARNFRKDAWKAPHGGGPYGFYLTLTDGYGSMPPYRSMTPAERYALVHYVREQIVKPANAAQYVDDSDAVRARIPKPDASAGPAAAAIAPAAIQPPAATWPLLAAIADDTARDAAATDAWLAQAGSTPLLAQLRAAPATAGRIRAALAGGDRDSARAALLTLPEASLLPTAEIDALLQRLSETKP